MLIVTTKQKMGSMGNRRAYRGGCVYVCLKADSIYPS